MKETIRDRLLVLISYIYYKRNRGGYAIFSQKDIEMLWTYFFGFSNNLESVTRELRRLVEEGVVKSFQYIKHKHKGPKMVYVVYAESVLPYNEVIRFLNRYNIPGSEIIMYISNIFRDKETFRPLALLYMYNKDKSKLGNADILELVNLGLVENGQITDKGKKLLYSLYTLLKYYKEVKVR